MRNIKLHFSRSTKTFNYFSRLLQWYEGLPVSHCLIEFDQPALGQPFVYHSVIGSGVSFMTKRRFLEINEIMETYIIEVEEQEYIQIRNALLDECGEVYGSFQNFGIFLVDQARRLGIDIENPFKKGKNCSELIYKHVITAIYGDNGYLPDLIKPSEIRNILLANYNLPIFSKILPKT